MTVHIDKAGRHEKAACVDCPGTCSADIANRHDAVTENCHIAHDAGFAAAIENRSASNHNIVLGWLVSIATRRQSQNDQAGYQVFLWHLFPRGANFRRVILIVWSPVQVAL
jgi:hypothetical protein